ncbi:hypothetical protein COV18_05845 [Candidatus Woesearchaeota archaeon CG10_big_fil_rev_8_21_14_0_10_37_12]|nr:MAG: hypothetical protein COV18_05845 [Candidatus Woesearchaeota archaeon CG10_big_fil_rev_8_21_14_0_10_37_12]
MEPNLLVKYSSQSGYLTGRSEVHGIINRLGDKNSEQELLAPGIMAVQTELKARKVTEELRDMYATDPDSIRHTTLWLPVDNWCDASEIAIRKSLEEDIKPLFTESDQYRIEIYCHKGELTAEKLKRLVLLFLKGTINEENPQKILRMDLFLENVAITVMRPKDIFSRA